MLEPSGVGQEKSWGEGDRREFMRQSRSAGYLTEVMSSLAG
jgi:hypothetical protein